MRVRFSSISLLELADAVKFYESQWQGLGLRFQDEIKAAAIRIKRYPLSWPVERGEIRRCLLHKFPYKILYSIESDHIFVIAIAHQHREPDYWIDRA